MKERPLDLDERFLIQEESHAAQQRQSRGDVPRRTIEKLVRSPHTLFRLCVDRFLVPWWLRRVGVRVGAGCSFAGYPLITLAPGASIALGDGVRLLSRADSNPAGLPHPTILAALAPGISIIIGTRTGMSGASVAARAGITIGNNVLIGAGACIWDTDFHPLDPNKRQEHETRDARSLPIRIENNVFIGARAMILKGVTVGCGAVIGAGSIVTKDVGAYQVAAGNPARILGSVFSHWERSVERP